MIERKTSEGFAKAKRKRRKTEKAVEKTGKEPKRRGKTCRKEKKAKRPCRKRKKEGDKGGATMILFLNAIGKRKGQARKSAGRMPWH